MLQAAGLTENLLSNDVVSTDGRRAFVEAIHALLQGKTHFPKTLPTKSASAVHEKLTDRELEVFRLIGEGRSTRTVATGFGVSVKTVEAHIANIKEKLQLGTRNQLMQMATLWLQNINAASLAPARRNSAAGRHP